MVSSEEQKRRELLGGLALAGRAYQEASSRMHAALLCKLGLSLIEERALDILEQQGPLTAGVFGRLVGLAPASVTGLIDRLVQRGFVRRTKDASDSRKVMVEAISSALEPLSEPLDELQREQEQLFAQYNNKQLETLYHFLTEASRIQRTATEKLKGQGTGNGEQGTV